MNLWTAAMWEITVEQTKLQGITRSGDQSAVLKALKLHIRWELLWQKFSLTLNIKIRLNEHSVCHS